MKQQITKEIEIPQEVEAKADGTTVELKGPKGTLKRAFNIPNVIIKTQENKIIVTSPKGTKREKTKIGTTTSHIKNMIKGIQDGYQYELKICSGHFPMNVSMSGKEFIVKNYLGEKIPRKITITDAVEVKVQGDKVIVNSTDKETAGKTAARIEQLTKVTNRDRRIFQDGIYITNKAGKQIA